MKKLGHRKFNRTLWTHSKGAAYKTLLSEFSEPLHPAFHSTQSINNSIVAIKGYCFGSQ